MKESCGNQENCKFNSKTSGGRIEFKNNTFFVSTGYFNLQLIQE